VSKNRNVSPAEQSGAFGPNWIRGKTRIVQLGRELAHGSQRLPDGLVTHGGSLHEELPEDVKTFAAHQIAALPHKVDGISDDFWLPTWVREHVDQNLSLEHLVEKIIHHVRANPHHEKLTEAQILLNEIGRSDEGTKIINRHVTHDLVAEIVFRGRPSSSTAVDASYSAEKAD
jgi:hypothetical protein